MEEYKGGFRETEIRINKEKIPFQELATLNGKVVEFILNGDKFTPDGREFPLFAIVNITGLDDEENLELTLRCQKNNGFMGGVNTYKGNQALDFMNGLYSIREVKDVEGREFS